MAHQISYHKSSYRCSGDNPATTATIGKLHPLEGVHCSLGVANTHYADVVIHPSLKLINTMNRLQSDLTLVSPMVELQHCCTEFQSCHRVWSLLGSTSQTNHTWMSHHI